MLWPIHAIRRERQEVKTALHRLYSKFVCHRSYIRSAISSVYYSYMYDRSSGTKCTSPLVAPLPPPPPHTHMHTRAQVVGCPSEPIDPRRKDLHARELPPAPSVPPAPPTIGSADDNPIFLA